MGADEMTAKNLNITIAMLLRFAVVCLIAGAIISFFVMLLAPELSDDVEYSLPVGAAVWSCALLVGICDSMVRRRKK